MKPILRNDYMNDQLYISEQYKWKFHNRPLIPNIVEEENLNDNEVEILPNNIIIEEEINNRKNKEVIMVNKEIQTIFRESETQTLPYSPDTIITNGTQPEVLLIKDFKYGKELPPSLDEMLFIEEKREKIIFEGALPPTSDEASFSLRRKLMEEQEIKEWRKREEEIKKNQNEKLNILQCALIEREKEINNKNTKRIEIIEIKQMEQKNRWVAKIQRKKIKILRKILKKKNNNINFQKRDIIEDYYNFASKVYANITREGLSMDKLSNKFEVNPYILQNYENINNLTKTMNKKYLEDDIDYKLMIKKINNNYTKLEQIHKNELNKAQEEIIGNNDQERIENNDGSIEFDIDKIKPRVQTPEYQHKNYFKNLENENVKVYDKLEKKEKAIILLQRLIRGRAIQNEIFVGKEKRLALIDELLIISSIPEFPKEKEEKLLKEQHEQVIKNSILEAIQGKIISNDLDKLNKILLRFKEEEKISKYVKDAEEERRKREIKETGRRQAEIKLKEREQLFYEEIMKVNQGTVDSYLSKIFDYSINYLSSKQALVMSEKRKLKMKSIQKNSNGVTILKDLVNCFLIPNIDKQKLKKQVNLEQKRYFESINHTVDNLIEKIK